MWRHKDDDVNSSSIQSQKWLQVDEDGIKDLITTLLQVHLPNVIHRIQHLVTAHLLRWQDTRHPWASRSLILGISATIESEPFAFCYSPSQCATALKFRCCLWIRHCFMLGRRRMSSRADVWSTRSRLNRQGLEWVETSYKSTST